MSQSRKHSIYETVTNTAIGYVVNFAGQMVIFPVFGYHPALVQNLGIGAFFTVLSLARGYCLRRLFNYFHIRF